MQLVPQYADQSREYRVTKLIKQQVELSVGELSAVLMMTD